MRVTLPLIFDSIQRTRSATTKDAFHKNTYLTKEGESVSINSRPGLSYIGDSANTYTAWGLYAHVDYTDRKTLFLKWDGSDWDVYECDGDNAPAKLTDVPSFTGDNNNHIVTWAEAGNDGTYNQITFGIGASNAFVLDIGSTVTAISDADFPGCGAGLLYIDGYTVASDGDIIGNSNLDDPFSWDALDFITPPSQDTTGIYWIALHQNHIASFGPNSIEFLYNAGNPTGTPFSIRRDVVINEVGLWTHQAALGAGVNVGHKPYVNIDGGNTGVFISQGANGVLGVHMLKNFQAIKISNTKIDRYLNYKETEASPRYPTLSTVAVDGKILVLLTLRSYSGSEAAQSFVYDQESNQWHEWTVDTNIHSTGAFNLAGSASLFYSDTGDTFRPLGTIVQFIDGKLYFVDESVFQDEDSTSTARDITVVIQTPKYAGQEGTRGLRKFQRELRAICDRPGASSDLTIEYTDDDYATFVSAGTLDVNDPASRIAGLGSFYERAFRLTYADNYKLRMRELESIINTGVS